MERSPFFIPHYRYEMKRRNLRRAHAGYCLFRIDLRLGLSPVALQKSSAMSLPWLKADQTEPRYAIGGKWPAAIVNYRTIRRYCILRVTGETRVLCRRFIILASRGFDYVLLH